METVKSRVMFVGIWLSLTMILFAALLKFFSGRDAITAPREWSTILWVVDLAIFVVAIVLSRSGLRRVAILLSILFAAFAVFHMFNLGKPCGCFGATSVSSQMSVVSNGLLALGLVFAAATAGTSKKLATIVVSSISLFSIIAGLIATETEMSRAPPADDFVDLRVLRGYPQPFTSQSNSRCDFSQNHWDIWLMSKRCAHCNELAIKLLDHATFSTIKQHEAEYYVVFRRHFEESKCDTAKLEILRSIGTMPNIIPLAFEVQDGIVVSCEIIR